MEKEIAIGPEGKAKIAVVAGKLVFTISHVHASGEVSLVVTESADYFLDELAKLIPGVWDDAVIALAKDAIKKI